ncbi:MAG: hypothetical protein H7068_02580 [Pedobacter sp.]|nr:hypothetical protein [Chitinophagaceae bacterium]
MQKIIFFCFTMFSIFSTTAQVPIVYYDFETDTHNAILTTVDLSASYSKGVNGGTSGTVGNSATISVTNSLGALNGAGNGAAYGGIAGMALGYTGFALGTASSNNDQAIIFSNFNCTGFNNLSVSFDAQSLAVGPANVDVYWSTDDITYTKANFTTNAITSSFSNVNFALQAGANGAPALYIKIIGYNGGVGTLLIDNFMLNASSYTNNNTTDNELMTLPSAKSIGTSMSSGGSYFPTYNNFIINSDPSNLLISRSIKFNGTLTLTNGNFQVNNSNTSVDSLIFLDSDVPIVSGAGTLGLNARSSLKFGDVGHTGGNAFTIPNSIFSNTSIGTLSINRDNSLILGNQPLTLTANVSPAITGNLNLIAGNFNDNGNVVNVQGNITGAGSHISTASGKIVMTGSGGKILPGLTYGNIEFNNIGGFTFTSSPTINGTLTLTTGAVTLGSNTLTLQNGNTPLSVTSGTLTTTSSSNLIFGTTGNIGGNVFSIPNNTFTSNPATIGSLSINRTNSFAFGNQAIVITGSLGLAAGTVDDNGNLISLGGNITGTGTHISSPGGKINMTGSGATISGATLGNIELNNVGGFALSASPIITGTLTLTNGALSVGSNTLTFQTGNTPINVGAGSITVSSTSNLAFGTIGNTGGIAFTIPDNTFTSAPDFNNLTVNRTNSLTLNNQNAALRGKLTLTSGTLILPNNYIFTLKSTSISNTALVDVVGASANIDYGTSANFLVERFIPQGLRAFRYMAPQVNSGTNTFFTTWQESGDTTSLFGTQISGKVGTINAFDATTGFDMTNTGNKSLFGYDVNTSTGNAGFTTYLSTNNTSTDTLSAYKGYVLTIRGNRKNNLGVDANTMNSNAILRSKGKLVTGTVSYNTSRVNGGGVDNTGIRLNFGSSTGFTMIGNPYVAPIDWVNILANTNNVTNIENNYWAYDPTIGTAGAYVVYNSISGSNTPASNINQYIQPGQAFFIKNNSSISPTFQIREADKVTASTLTAVFGGSNSLSKISVSLQKPVNGNMITMDGDNICFSSNFLNGLGREDASKFTNSTENIAINSNGKLLSIDGRLDPTISDSISLRIYQVISGVNYRLKINLAEFNANGLQAYLKDRFTATQTALVMGGDNTYSFTTTVDTTSYNNRFTIVYQNSTLPINFMGVKAYENNKGVSVDWEVIESNISHYDVEYSNNGQQFTKLTTVKSTGSNNSTLQSYKWYHNLPQSGSNYYRIKSVEVNGIVKFSNVVSVVIGTQPASVLVYPNPVTDGKVNLQLTNIIQGNYSINVNNNLGQKIYTTTVNHNGGSGSYLLTLPTLAKGSYSLVMTNGTFKKQQIILVE